MRDGLSLSGGLKRVTPGDETKSFLYLKLSAPSECVTVGSTQAGERMPKDRPTVSAALVAQVKQWIASGRSCN